MDDLLHQPDVATPEQHHPPVVPGAVVPPATGAALLLPAAGGPGVLVPATVDSDADGFLDTAVNTTGPLLELATDVDRDGDVDVLTTLAADGSARTVDPSHGIAGGWDPGWDAPAPPAPTLDPVTGRWTRGS